jgi:hypothetical protein
MNKIHNVKKSIYENHKIQKMLFQYIYEENFKEIEKIMDEYKTFNYNIIDEKHVYFIEYLILFNKPFLIKKFFLNGIENILNINMSQMIEIIIKFSYLEIMNILIEQNKKKIGFNIFETYDEKYDLPLFCALSYENIEFVKLSFSAMKNIYLKNKNGNNALHEVIINSENFELFLVVDENFKNKNIYNEDGNTAILLAIQYKRYDVLNHLLKNESVDIYLKNIKNNFSVLHYIILSSDIKILNIFKNYISILKTLSNNQDISGNIFFHYFINFLQDRSKDINNEFFKFCIDIDPNYNIQNIDGNIGMHLIFNNSSNLQNIDIITFLIKKSNINIQNNYGFSCFFLMIIHKIYIDYIDILKYKKINIFLYNNKRINIFHYIKNDTPEYKNLINFVADSYINNVSSDKIYHDYWDNKYTHDFKKLNAKDRIELKNMNIENINTSDKQTIFKKIIIYKINKNVQYFLTNNIILNTMYSYPKITIYPELIVNYKNILISTYTSDIINIFFGLLYINKMFKNVATILNIINKNDDLFYYDSKNIKNFQLLWKNYKLLNVFENLGEKINYYMQNDYSHFILTIGIEIYINDLYQGHSNVLIFDLKNKKVERFEPYGHEPNFFKYDDALFDLSLKNFIKTIDVNFKYVSPKDYALKIGFQTMEVNETESYVGDPDGYCSAWCLFWTVLKIQHPSITSQKLFILIIREVMNKGITYKSLIRFFCYNITDIRDTFLKTIDININDWMNGNITNEQLNKLNKLLLIEISQYK